MEQIGGISAVTMDWWDMYGWDSFLVTRQKGQRPIVFHHSYSLNLDQLLPLRRNVSLLSSTCSLNVEIHTGPRSRLKAGLTTR